MATSYYSTGTVSLTNGSAVVTGNGTLWQAALITNGLIAVEAAGNLLLIASVDSDSQITAEQEWVGASGTYSYGILRNTDQMEDNAENSRALSYLISELRNGTLFKYDGAGDFANRAIHDSKPKGYSYLVLEGDAAQLYVKASNAEGDWAGPFAYGVGPVGPQGPVGFLDFKGEYDPATEYVANDGVLYNGSSWVALQDTTGNAPPNLPTTENAYWSLLAVKGQDGTGIGDMLASVYDPQNLQKDAFDRGNHTGEQPISSVANLAPSLAGKQAALGWVPIQNIDITSPVSAIVISFPAGVRSIRLTGSVVASNRLTGITRGRFSFDGGATYVAGGSSYRTAIWQVANGTPAYNAGTPNDSLLIATEAGDAALISGFNCIIDMGGASDWTSVYTQQASYDTAPRLVFTRGYTISPGMPTHLQLFLTTGTFNPGTRLLVEGF